METRATYTQEAIAGLGAKDLKGAIRALVRSDAADDAMRLAVIARASALEVWDALPNHWDLLNGGLMDKHGAWAVEQRDTAMDVFTALDGAVEDACEDAFPGWYVWVQDWYGSGTDESPYVVVYAVAGDLWAAEFSYGDDEKLTVDVENATKVRPITSYVERKRASAPRNRRSEATEQRQLAREEMRGVRETRQAPITEFEIREVPNGSGGTDLHFEGYASVTCADYDDRSNSYEMEDYIGPWVESMVSGCFTRTIREGCDTCLVVNHTGVSMARTKPGTLQLAEDSTGLHVDARLNPVRADVQILRAAIEDGAIDEMSFAFQVMRQKWSYLEENGEIDRRWITEVSLNKGDVSPVNYGANPNTGGTVSMRSAMTLLSARGLTWRALAAALKDIRAGKALSQATLDVLQPILDDLGAIDKLVDADQPKLADLLGVANPDDDDDGDDGEPDGDEDRSAQIIVLPDHTSSARAALAAARR